MTESDSFCDKMYCRMCQKQVNISTNKAIVETDLKGYFWIYCKNCSNIVSESNDTDFLNGVFGEDEQ